MTIVSETRALSALRQKLAELFALRERGGGLELREARGWIDGYMSALIDSGVATSQELLEMVTAERRRRSGPGSSIWVKDATDETDRDTTVPDVAACG
jgi:hypothetical protein